MKTLDLLSVAFLDCFLCLGVCAFLHKEFL
jgi:hypothetical protein